MWIHVGRLFPIRNIFCIHSKASEDHTTTGKRKLFLAMEENVLACASHERWVRSFDNFSSGEESLRNLAHVRERLFQKNQSWNLKSWMPGPWVLVVISRHYEVRCPAWTLVSCFVFSNCLFPTLQNFFISLQVLSISVSVRRFVCIQSAIVM